MTIERTAEEVIIRLPANVEPEGLQRLVDYLVYQAATAGSQATQAAVDELAREVNRDWWAANRDRLLR